MSARDPRFVELSQRICALVLGGDESLDDLCSAIFQWQYDNCGDYRDICDRRSVGSVSTWRQVPAVPVDAFKSLDFRTFPSSQAQSVFSTSGTTTGDRGLHYFCDLSLYRLASMRAFSRALIPDGASLPVVSLIPSVAQEPDSSLSQMVTWILEEMGSHDTVIDPSGDTLTRLTQPTLILGTAISLAAAFEKHGDLELPVGTRIMETGGFKGRRRAITRAGLWRLYERAGVSSRWVVGEYGMTELSSQWYDGVAGCATDDADARVYRAPAWARTRVVDPVTLQDVSYGQVGLLMHLDPVNLGSVQAVLTGDLGERVAGEDGRHDGFRYRGRATGAAVRGCSLRADP